VHAIRSLAGFDPCPGQRGRIRDVALVATIARRPLLGELLSDVTFLAGQLTVNFVQKQAGDPVIKCPGTPITVTGSAVSAHAGKLLGGSVTLSAGQLVVILREIKTRPCAMVKWWHGLALMAVFTTVVHIVALGTQLVFVLYANSLYN